MGPRNDRQKGADQLVAGGSEWFANPFAGMRRLSAEMERFLDSMRGGRARPWRDFEVDGAWLPDVEVLRKKGNLVVRADVPGMTKDDITVTITDETLTIEGERKLDETEKGEGYYRSERAYGRFHRRLALPEGVDADQATARFKDGVLEVSMPAPAPRENDGHRLEIAST